ncbi:MAG TPA: hypothetical protein VMY99_00125 [Nevskiaceae bacterium]|nr:hypothetical protein [Nevskiaceae bacterium]
MVCIYCGCATQVVNSRLQKRDNHVWRRRRCSECGSVFTTQEQAVLSAGLVYQDAGGRMQPFSRDTLFLSIYDSCKHRSQAVADASALAQTVIGKLIKNTANGMVERSHVLAAAIEVLGNFDATAATVYKAYHAPR